MQDFINSHSSSHCKFFFYHWVVFRKKNSRHRSSSSLCLPGNTESHTKLKPQLQSGRAFNLQPNTRSNSKEHGTGSPQNNTSIQSGTFSRRISTWKFNVQLKPSYNWLWKLSVCFCFVLVTCKRQTKIARLKWILDCRPDEARDRKPHPLEANPSSSLYTQSKTTVILSVYQWQLSLFAKQNKTKHKTKSVVCGRNPIQSGSSPHYFAAFICVSNKLQTEHVQKSSH